MSERPPARIGGAGRFISAMKSIWVPLMFTCAVGCASSTTSSLDEADGFDAGVSAEGQDSAGEFERDSGPMATDARFDAAHAPAADAATRDTATSTTPDATSTPKGDANVGDAAPRARDAQDDAIATTDGADNRVCLGQSAACDAANRADDAIRAQLSGARYQCTDGDRKCGAVNEGGTGPFTFPLICRGSIWRLGGVEYATGEWIPFFTCSHGCGLAPAICDP